MTSKQGLRLLAPLAALVLALGLGACGDGGGNDADASPGTTGAAVTPSTEAGGATTATVDIKDFAYSPDQARAKVGGEITWTNRDGFAHTVTGTGGATFKSGDLASGATFRHTFTTAGTFKYFCSIHNSMTGSVTVS